MIDKEDDNYDSEIDEIDADTNNDPVPLDPRASYLQSLFAAVNGNLTPDQINRQVVAKMRLV